MRIAIPKAFTSIWSGLLTGAVVTAAALLPTMASAQAQSSIKASAQSELKDQTNQWSDNNTANAGDTLKYIVNYQNVGSSDQKQVVVRASLPTNVSLVPGTTMIYNSNNPNGTKASADSVTSDQGLAIGDYGPGANAYIIFQAQIAGADKLSCGDNQLKLNGSVQPQGADKSAVSATTTVKRDCTSQPAPSPTPAPTQSQSTPPAKPAPTPSPTPVPATPSTPAPAASASGALPNTGAGDVFAIFGVAAAAGIIAHKLYLRRFAGR